MGALSIGFDGGVVELAALGDDRADALHKAAILAERLVSDPVMAAILPPSAQSAVNAARELSLAAKAGPGPLRSVWSSLTGPGARRLAIALARDQAKTRAAAREVGILPFVILAAKYGPGAVKAAQKLIAARKAQKAAARARRAAAQAAQAAEAQGVPADAIDPDVPAPEAEAEAADVGAWWSPITHTKKTISVLKKLSPTHQVLKRVVKARKKKRAARAAREEQEAQEDEIDDQEAEGDEATEGGDWIPDYFDDGGGES
jgi:hypothetical protein